MNSEELLRRLRATFLEELGEQVEELDQVLLGLERSSADDERAGHVNRLFRIAHNLKGAARAVELRAVERVCHLLEDVFSRARSDAGRLEPPQVEALFEVADAFRAVCNALAAGAEDPEAPLAAALDRLGALAGKPAVASPGPPEKVSPPLPAPTESPAPPPEPRDEAPLRDTAPVRADPSGGHVRIATGKLDALADVSSELLIGHQRWEDAYEQARAIAEGVRSMLAQWRGLARGLGSDRATGEGDRASTLEWLRRCQDDLVGLERKAESLVRTAADQLVVNQEIVESLNTEVRRVRMVPFSDACAGLDRMIRDLARSRGKRVDLTVVGGEVEIDRSVIDLLKPPLLHLVRNGIEHGIEPPAARLGAGKAEAGSIVIGARLEGSRVEVTVEDDGAGIDLAGVRRKAEAMGLAPPQDDADTLDLMFLPGFTTASTVTEVAGRGVGLDVVKENVEARRGEVAVSFVPGQGTRFVIRLPLTLTVLRSLLLSSGGQTYAVDMASARRILSIGDRDVRSVEGRQWVQVDERTLPVAALETLLDADRAPASRGGARPGIWVAGGGWEAVVLVDELLGEQDLLVKPLGERIRGIAGFSGCSVLVSGRIALVLNLASLLGRLHRGRRTGPSGPAGETARAVKRVLVADDSVTTRTVEARIIADAGYEVVTAVDGAEAWRLVQDSEPDIVVSDIEMPHMDGFELTRTIRSSARFKDLPVVLVTSLARSEDRARGLEVGASAYIVKSTFEDRTLLQAIGQLV